MAKKNIQPKKTPSAKKVKKASARKATPKKKARAVATSKAKATSKKTRPKKKVKVAANKAQPRKGTMGTHAPRKTPKKLPTKKKAPPTKAANNAEAVATMKDDLQTAFVTAIAEIDRAGRLRNGLRSLSLVQLCAYWGQHYGFQPGSKWLASRQKIHRMIDEHIAELEEARIVEDLEKEGENLNEELEKALTLLKNIKGEEASSPATEADANEPASYPNLRRRVAELLNKLNDDELQWLHFEITDPDVEGEIETAEEAEEVRDNFPPLNRAALVQELTTIAMDEFHLADDSDLAERLRDENSIYRFLVDNK